MRIKFFYQCFKWENGAKGKAAVHCVISGLTLKKEGKSVYFKWDEGTKQHTPQQCENINAYGLIGKSFLVKSESKALSASLPMVLGNKPNDGGALILSPAEYEDFKQNEPRAVPFIKKLIGSEEFLHNRKRYCLWLVNVSPSILSLPKVKERIDKCKEIRLSGKDAGTRKLAERPSQFRDLNNPKTAIVIPSVSSEKRKYIPIGFIGDDTIATNAVHIVPNGDRYEFGILTSRFHMVWMRTVCGRLKSDYRYSRDLCYNTFPWPKDVTDEQKKKISVLAQKILDLRKYYEDADPEIDLATMYNTMTPELNKAHENLDKAVERLYNRVAFKSDAERLNTLISLYEEKQHQLLMDFSTKKKRKAGKKQSTR